jgi:hypothetical protein
VDIDLADVGWKTTLLRAYLDGVDVAVQLAITNVALFAGPPPPGDFVVTRALLRMIAGVAAGRLTDGSVTGLTISGGVATVEFAGPSSDQQLGLFCAALRRHVDASTTTIRVVTGTGDVVFEDRH